ncbi:hypothetical protein BXY51_006444 [Actinoplanes cyaneus]|nr:hypothetical protein [Actinoplanes cyaneus]
MESACGAAAVLRPGGPVRVPLRECCVAALVGARSSSSGCEALDDPRPLVPSRPVEVVRAWP